LISPHDTGRRRPAGLLFFLALLLSLLLAPPGGGSSAFAYRVPIRLFRITGMGGSLGFSTGLSNSDQENKHTGTPAQSTNRSYSEHVSLGFSGYVYHPYLLTFRGHTSLGLQRSISNSGSNRERTLRHKNLLYDLYIKILKRKSLNLALNFNRDRTINWGTFSEDRIQTSTLEEAILSYKNDVFPCTVRARKNSRRQEADTTYTDTSHSISATGTYSNDRIGTADISYSSGHAMTENTDIDTRDHTFSLHHFLSFGRGGTRLRDTFMMMDRRGTTNTRKQILFSTGVSTRLSSSLRSGMGYSFHRSTQMSDLPGSGKSRSTSQSGSWSLGHQLYRSLSTSLSISGSKSRYETGSFYQTKERARWRYNKKIPAGNFHLSYGLSFRQHREDMEAGTNRVNDEKHKFGENPTEPDVIELRYDFANTKTIEIFDASGLFPAEDRDGNIMAEGVHYEVHQDANGVTRLQLLPPYNDPASPESLIGYQTLTLIYEYQVLSSLDYNSFGQGYGIGFSLWQHLAFGYGASVGKHKKIHGVDTGNRIDSTRSKQYRISLHYPHSDTRAVRKEFRSKRAPRESEGITESIHYRLPYHITWNMHAAYSRTKSFSRESTSYSRSIGTGISTLLPYRISWGLSGNYSNRSSTNDQSISFNISSHLSWSYRRFNIQLNYDLFHSRYEFTGTREKRRLYLSATRDF